MILTHTKTLKTSFIESTAFIRCTGGHADAITALESAGTVRGGVAGAGDPDTLHLWVASEVLGTHTLLPVSGHAAVGIEAAGSLAGARIIAPTILTHLIGLTVSISGAGA